MVLYVRSRRFGTSVFPVPAAGARRCLSNRVCRATFLGIVLACTSFSDNLTLTRDSYFSSVFSGTL